MLKQFFINRYFKKLSNTPYLQNDDECIIGKAKDVIKELANQINYINSINDENATFITLETTSLIEEIQKRYHNLNNVIGIFYHPMADFYTLQDKNKLFDTLKEYYNESEEKWKKTS